MASLRIGGGLLLLTGVALFILGMGASYAMANRWSNDFTGHLTGAAGWYMASGGATALGGLMLAMLSGVVLTKPRA